MAESAHWPRMPEKSPDSVCSACAGHPTAHHASDVPCSLVLASAHRILGPAPQYQYRMSCSLGARCCRSLAKHRSIAVARTTIMRVALAGVRLGIDKLAHHMPT